MRDGANGIVMSTEEYFENIERDQQRMFSNLVNPVDLANGFRRARSEGGNGSGNVVPINQEIFVPVSYDIPQDSILTSRDTATLSLLALGVPSITGNHYQDEEQKVFVASEYPKDWRENVSSAGDFQTTATVALEIDSLFGSDEIRHLGTGFLQNMNNACDYVRNMVQTDRGYDKTAELIREGLKGIRKAYDSKNVSEMKSAVRGYVYCNLCEKALDLLDDNPVLNQKAGISKQDREYYEGMRQFAKMIRENEKLLERQAKGFELSKEDENKIQEYKDFQYVVGRENVEKDYEDPEASAEIAVAMAEMMNKGKSNKKNKSLSEEEQKQWDKLAHAAGPLSLNTYRYNKSKENSFVRELGKCKAPEAVDGLLNKVSKQADEYRQANDEKFQTAVKIVDEKIATTHLDKENLKKYNNDENMRVYEKNAKEARKQLKDSLKPEKQQAADPKFKFKLVEEYYNKINTESYDKKKHQNEKKHPDFQRMKKAVTILRNYLDNVASDVVKYDAELEKRYVKELNEAAESYLNIKDPKKKREYRSNKSYANNRYNMALGLSKLTENPVLNLNYVESGSRQLMDDLYKDVMKNASRKEKERFLGVNPEIKRKSIEMVLWRHDRKMAEKMVSQKLLHEKLNLDSLPKNIKDEMKAVLDQMAMFKYGGKAAVSGLSLGKSEDKQVLKFLEEEITSYKAGTNTTSVEVHNKPEEKLSIRKRAEQFENKAIGKK